MELKIEADDGSQVIYAEVDEKLWNKFTDHCAETEQDISDVFEEVVKQYVENTDISDMIDSRMHNY